MLVYFATPNGVLYLDNYKIYGKQTGQHPQDIPFQMYLKCRDVLEDATYREGTLTKIFGRPFPEVAFRYSELRYVPDRTLDVIGPLMMDNYDVEWSHKKKVDQIKVRLADESPSA
jgi:hypothetical protein